MQQERINRVCEEMKKDGISQLLVTIRWLFFI